MKLLLFLGILESIEFCILIRRILGSVSSLNRLCLERQRRCSCRIFS